MVCATSQATFTFAPCPELRPQTRRHASQQILPISKQEIRLLSTPPQRTAPFRPTTIKTHISISTQTIHGKPSQPRGTYLKPIEAFRCRWQICQSGASSPLPHTYSRHNQPSSQRESHINTPNDGQCPTPLRDTPGPRTTGSTHTTQI